MKRWLLNRSRIAIFMEPRNGFSLLVNGYEEQHRHCNWPRQRLLRMPARSDPRRHAGSRQGSLPRALAEELGVARNTVLYAYEQLASEGL
jgi:GntR family transcriptional regulator/MocR family aminotransferase